MAKKSVDFYVLISIQSPLTNQSVLYEVYGASFLGNKPVNIHDFLLI